MRSQNKAKQELFAQMKSLGLNQKTIAAKLEISEKSASIWAHNPRIKARINELQKEYFFEAQAMLLGAQREAIETVQALLRSRDENVRLKAAIVILRQCETFPDFAL